MGVRYGEDFAGTTQEARLGEPTQIGEVSVRFTPAGHVLGSAQVVIEAGGTRLVVSGDYKRVEDPTCAAYELVPCDVFITEATFGLPVFHHADARSEIRLLDSAALFPERACRRRLCSRQGATRHGAPARGRLRPTDLPAWRAGTADRVLQERRHRARRHPEGGGDRARQARRRGRALPSVRDPGPVVPPLPGPGDVLRLRMDAGACTSARTPARDLRPFRLGRSLPHGPRDRRRRGLGHSRPGGCAGPLVSDERHPRAAAAHARLRRRGRSRGGAPPPPARETEEDGP